MEPPVALIWILPGVPGLLTLACGLTARRARRGAAALLDTPTRKVAEVSEGFVEVKGRLVAESGPLLSSPIGGEPCVFYALEVERRDRTQDGASWRTIVKDEQSLEVCVDDGTGRIGIDLARAERTLSLVVATTSVTSAQRKIIEERYNKKTKGLLLSKKLRVHEYVFRPDVEVFAAGNAVADPDRNRYRLTKGGPRFVVSSGSEEHLVEQMQRRARRFRIATGVLGAITLVLAAGATDVYFGLGLNLLRRLFGAG